MADGREPWEDVLDDPGQALYPVGVVAELMGVDPQVVRGYDKRGLVVPERSEAGQRRYSREDIRRLARAMELAGEGIPSTGIDRILTLEDELSRHERTAAETAASGRSSGEDRERDGGRSGSDGVGT